MKRILFGKKKTKKGKRRTDEAPGPLYKYAINEYRQTVAPQSGNDDGRRFDQESQQHEENDPRFSQRQQQDFLPMSTPRRKTPTHQDDSFLDATTPGMYQNMRSTIEAEPSPVRDQPRLRAGNTGVEAIQHGSTPNKKNLSVAGPRAAMAKQNKSFSNSELSGASSAPSFQRVHSDVASVYKYHDTSFRRPILPQPAMPDTTYEEHYGDAYVGAPLKYVYPAGYQSMRPRGGPWKLSIVVCVLFTWLSVFIVGHCSDRVDQSQYQNSEIDDDTLVIETRWCGSRLLYFMWVMSMLITGLAAAYCSIIGYIKVRDFAVANSRSQPPGMTGKSDYYVRIDDGPLPTGRGSGPSYASGYQKTIYQADGTPQFWGTHIYRPTQAAVAVTSR